MSEESKPEPSPEHPDGGRQGQQEPAGGWPAGTKEDQEGKQVLTEK